MLPPLLLAEVGVTIEVEELAVKDAVASCAALFTEVFERLDGAT